MTDMTAQGETKAASTGKAATSPVDYALVLGLLVLALWAGLEPMAQAFSARYAEAEVSRFSSDTEAHLDR